MSRASGVGKPAIVRAAYRTLCVLLVILVAGACSRPASIGYDPGLDPVAQLDAARQRAQQERKLILVIAGGDWCKWCHVLHRFIHQNPEIDAALDATFVRVKVYVGEDNFNEAFFATLPQMPGVPHLWVLAADGTVLESVHTEQLEDEADGYDAESFAAFIDAWRRRAAG